MQIESGIVSVGMSIRSKRTRSKTGSQRAHHALKEPRITGVTPHLRHCADAEGMYRGREVIKVKTKAEKDSTQEESSEKKTVQHMEMPKEISSDK